MLGRFVDALARRLATPMSRRAALGTIGAATIVAALPARRARATPSDCAGTCGAGETVCQHDLPTCTPYTCCSGSQPMCCAGPASATCCKPGCSCGPDGRGFHSCQNCPKCDQGWTECGNSCCTPGVACAGGMCCYGGEACGSRCCTNGTQCLDASTGTCGDRCGSGRETCGSTCCPRGSYCCDDKRGLCCKTKGGGCCRGAAQTMFCCNTPNTCAKLGDASGMVPAGTDGNVCCPPERLSNRSKAGSSCCPPGFRGLNGKFVSNSGNSGGSCCRATSTCGKGKHISCCASDQDLAGTGQVCCKGTCMRPAEFLTDPKNCGGCGIRCKRRATCEAGVCVQPGGAG